MKKILILILGFIMVLSLASCVPTQGLNEYRSDLEDLEIRVAEMEYILDNLGILTGLNGQQSYYIVPQEEQTASIFQNVSAMEEMVSDLDKSKLPPYLFDLEGNPVSFNDVGELLLAKYYGSNAYDETYYRVGFQTKIRMTITDENMTIDQFMARTILMVEELGLYQYWLLGGSELYLQITFNDTNFEIFIYMPSLLSEAFNLTPSDYYNQYWEIETKNLIFDLEQTQIYYDEFILNETFIGYVLDYK